MATIEYAELTRPNPSRPKELVEVRALATDLRMFMERTETQQLVAAANVLHSSSSNIQAVLLDEARRLGFQSERKGLFSKYPAGGMRPDYYRRMGDSGILLEVERGKTLANNKDLLDLWKCHICTDADYLFLFVPRRRPHGNGKDTPVFGRVVNRLSTFFEEPNIVNVEAAVLFGY